MPWICAADSALGIAEAVEPWVHGSVDVVGEERRVIVHPDQHLGPPRAARKRIANEAAGARLLLDGHGVLEVEDDGVGPAIVGLFHEAPDIDGRINDERRACGGGHRQMIPFWVSAPMRSSE